MPYNGELHGTRIGPIDWQATTRRVLALRAVLQSGHGLDDAAGPLEALPMQIAAPEWVLALLARDLPGQTLSPEEQRRGVHTVHTRWNGNPRVMLREHSAMSDAERYAYDAVVSDFIRHTPDLLAVETRIRNERLTGYPGGFDHLVYYGRDPRFAACFMEYQLAAALQDYLLFRRQGPRGSTRKGCIDGG